MAKRGESGISCVLAVNKPVGMTSHDVVNRIRRLTGERRVGHAGTLDPLASGVMLVCVGPATRLVNHLQGHDKAYAMGVLFGAATETDDAEGAVTTRKPVPASLYDEGFAQRTVEGLVGRGLQMPPVYSAIKKDGKKAYEQARKGNVIELDPRPFEVHAARLESVQATGVEETPLVWNVHMDVSKGTYMRSIARDLGVRMGTVAHVCSLERTRIGQLPLSECVDLEDLDPDPLCAQVDPLRLLGIRWAFVQDTFATDNGNAIPAQELSLNQRLSFFSDEAECCSSSVYPSSLPPADDELVGVVHRHELRALYRYDRKKDRYLPVCVFPQGVSRGTSVHC